MVLFEAIILGIIQGITEFLPISSSAHLILFPWMIRSQGTLIDSLNFDVALHAGTLVAILGFFWKDWLDLLAKFFRGFGDASWKTGEGRMVWFIVLATIPAGVLGLKFEHVVEHAFRNPLLIAASLTVISIVIWACDRYGAKAAALEKMTLGQSLFIGCAQALALVPGVSRSGITISAGLMAGYTRESAARFSFLLSTPVIAGASVLKLAKLKLAPGEAVPFLAGVACSAIVGYLSIKFLLSYLSRHSMDLFVWYRLALAAAVVLLWAARM
ncbi:MAG TPA: undecaprenyl-diphosphatase UppP [Nitrospirota bacterium]|nr:undecaprenyl-diphosphatase UppP [Nitrospirota bacterium]